MRKKYNKIKEIAEDVYDSLGSGFNEDVYERAMLVAFRQEDIPYENQRVVELRYKDHYVGEGYPDIIITMKQTKIVLELKATGNIGEKEKAQLRNYLNILDIKRGALINFQSPTRSSSETELQFKRVKI